MKFDITEYEKKYSFDLETITQLCGQNIVKKTYILESIRRYFSTYKYSEEKNKWRNNVKINGENVGRKFFSVISVSNVKDILSEIKISKQSLMIEYLKALMQKFDFQFHMRTIIDELDAMFHILNTDVGRLGDVELSYAVSDLWNMIQKSEIEGGKQERLEDKENYELLKIFFNLLEEIMMLMPKKTLVLLENIDHWISQDEYRQIVDRIQEIGKKYDVYFVLTTSMEGYVVCDEEICQGINIVGKVQFQMPEFNVIEKFIIEAYPYNAKLSREDIQKDLEKIMQKIGQKGYLYSIEESVVCKLINQTLFLKDSWRDDGKMPEIAFLKA